MSGRLARCGACRHIWRIAGTADEAPGEPAGFRLPAAGRTAPSPSAPPREGDCPVTADAAGEAYEYDVFAHRPPFLPRPAWHLPAILASALIAAATAVILIAGML